MCRQSLLALIEATGGFQSQVLLVVTQKHVDKDCYAEQILLLRVYQGLPGSTSPA